MRERHLFERVCGCLAAICLSASGATGQTADRYVGTVQKVQTTPASVEITNESGAQQILRVVPETLIQRIAPGAKDLKEAQAANLADVATGDRVLVALQPGTQDLLRLVVMPAADIARRNQAEREDWQKRGVAGVVAGISGNEISIQVRSMMPGSAGVSITVAVDEKTRLRRYAPDSVRFVDAQPAAISDISVGDQVRARGAKNEDGSRVSAEEVVFGTFVTRLGSVTAVDPASRQITITDSNSHEPVIVKLADGSQIKRMDAMRFGAPAQGAPMGGGMAGPPNGMRPPDMSQMLEAMPAASIDDVRPGETIIVSATKGTAADHLTAITIISNAGMLVQMASMFAGSGQRGAPGRPPGGMNGGMGEMPGGFSLDGMQIPGMTQ